VVAFAYVPTKQHRFGLWRAKLWRGEVWPQSKHAFKIQLDSSREPTKSTFWWLIIQTYSGTELTRITFRWRNWQESLCDKNWRESLLHLHYEQWAKKIRSLPLSTTPHSFATRITSKLILTCFPPCSPPESLLQRIKWNPRIRNESSTKVAHNIPHPLQLPRHTSVVRTSPKICITKKRKKYYRKRSPSVAKNLTTKSIHSHERKKEKRA
jgi:hypothetical protein